MEELNKGLTRLIAELAIPTNILCAEALYHGSLLCQSQLLDGKLYPICNSRDLEELRDVIGVYIDEAPIHIRIEGVVFIVLREDIGVEDSHLLVLDGPL